MVRHRRALCNVGAVDAVAHCLLGGASGADHRDRAVKASRLAALGSNKKAQAAMSELADETLDRKAQHEADLALANHLEEAC
eukprot:m.288095 g.288095  ORF g.288095 m.288095 type:complete len:82 (-) comp27085_c0_seq23:716-961(-)